MSWWSSSLNRLHVRRPLSRCIRAGGKPSSLSASPSRRPLAVRDRQPRRLRPLVSDDHIVWSGLTSCLDNALVRPFVRRLRSFVSPFLRRSPHTESPSFRIAVRGSPCSLADADSEESELTRTSLPPEVASKCSTERTPPLTLSTRNTVPGISRTSPIARNVW